MVGHGSYAPSFAKVGRGPTASSRVARGAAIASGEDSHGPHVAATAEAAKVSICMASDTVRSGAVEFKILSSQWYHNAVTLSRGLCCRICLMLIVVSHLNLMTSSTVMCQ